MFLKYLLNKDTLVKKLQTDDFAAFINKKKAAYSTLFNSKNSHILVGAFTVKLRLVDCLFFKYFP